MEWQKHRSPLIRSFEALREAGFKRKGSKDLMGVWDDERKWEDNTEIKQQSAVVQ